MGIRTCLILISVCAEPVPGWTRTSAVPRATDASEGSLEEIRRERDHTR